MENVWIKQEPSPDSSDWPLQFRNLTPYNIVVRHSKRGDFAQWKLNKAPVDIEYVPDDIKCESLSDEAGFPVYYPTSFSGFKSGLPFDRTDNIIVTVEVGRIMKQLQYPWRGYVISPAIHDDSADFENNTWTVNRMIYWRLSPLIKIS